MIGSKGRERRARRGGGAGMTRSIAKVVGATSEEGRESRVAQAAAADLCALHLGPNSLDCGRFANLAGGVMGGPINRYGIPGRWGKANARVRCWAQSRVQSIHASLQAPPKKKWSRARTTRALGVKAGEHGRAGPNRVSWAISVDPPCWLAALPLKVLGRTGARPAWAPMMTKVGTAS